jgi:hypothetical protein
MPPFEYKPFVNPYIGSISELMGKGDEAKAQALLRIGEIQAREAEQRGQAWGNAIQGIGNIASKTITDYNSPEAQDRREAEKARAIFNDMRKAETQTTNGVGYRNFTGDEVPAELTRSELSFDRLGNPKVGADGKLVRTEVPGAAAVAAISGRQGLPTVTRSHPYRKLADVGVEGLDTWDIDAVNKNFAENDVSPELAFKYTQIMRASNDDMEKHHANAMDIMRKNASDILQLSPDARLGAAQQLLEKYQNNGVLSYKDLQNARQQLESIAALPAGEQAVATSKFLMGLSGQKPTIVTTGAGETSRVLQTNEVVSQGPSPAPSAASQTLAIARADFDDGIRDGSIPAGTKFTDWSRATPAVPSLNEVQLALDVANGKPGAQKAWEIYQKANMSTAAAGATAPPGADFSAALPADSMSQNLLSQSGLSFNAFMVLTGRGGQLARDQATRNRANAEVDAWARRSGQDVSTFQSQYIGYNKALEANVQRRNNTLTAESEVVATLENLDAAAREAGLSDVRMLNEFNLWLKGEGNSPDAATYAFHFNQLRNDLAQYNAASQGRPGVPCFKPTW